MKMHLNRNTRTREHGQPSGRATDAVGTAMGSGYVQLLKPLDPELPDSEGRGTHARLGKRSRGHQEGTPFLHVHHDNFPKQTYSTIRLFFF